jgi:hypothetical protein
VLHGDGSTVADQQVYVSCADPVGAYDDMTDDHGRFEVRPVYVVADTLLYPFPPRQPDGSFDITCQASARVANDQVIRQGPFAVRFTPTRGGVVATTTELREVSEK